MVCATTRYTSGKIHTPLDQGATSLKGTIVTIRIGGEELLMDEIGKGLSNTISERMRPETVELVSKLCSENISYEDGAALLWYVRNLIYFDLMLHDDRRVLLVNYEDLVREPKHHFRRVFDFIGCQFSYKYINNVSATSIKKSTFPSIHPEIKSLCKD